MNKNAKEKLFVGENKNLKKIINLFSFLSIVWQSKENFLTNFVLKEKTRNLIQLLFFKETFVVLWKHNSTQKHRLELLIESNEIQLPFQNTLNSFNKLSKSITIEWPLSLAVLNGKIFQLTVKCWNNHALRIFVATFGKIPLFFEFFLEVGSSSSQPSVPSPLPTLALLASPEKYVETKKYEIKKFRETVTSTYLTVYKKEKNMK